MSTIFIILLIAIFVIAVDLAYSLFQTTVLYRSLRNLIWRYAEKLMCFIFG
jgi:cell division protein FtsL